MEQAGSLKSLAERMQEKAEQERIQTEKLFASELENLRRSLQTSSKNALATMENAITTEIADATERLSRHCQTLNLAYGRAWVRTAITAMAALLGLMLGGWMLMEGAVYWLAGYRQELAQVKVELREQRETMENIKTKTWDLTLRESENGRFIVLPAGMKYATGWTVGDRQAIKLE